MKKLIFCIFLSLNLAFGFSEGEDYIKLEKPLNVGENSLVKVFSYACIFCYKYDKGVTPKLLKSLEGVKFTPYHLSQKGDFGLIASEIFATLIALDEKNGTNLLDENSLFKRAKFAIYNAYHDKKMQWQNERDFLDFALKSVGLSQDEFKEARDLARTNELLKAWQDSYEVAKIQGVPSFVVNGKFLVLTKNVKSVDDLASLIEFLLKK
ncbi:thiol:disulfide interchange protein DsbA/DsbL [Campylobacter gastrosuis]|uniref:Thiol:disulfide interchange protein DsbA n=1 Tax=Campylobacter gastrosuis TaxID=2974576 RepID=A0ABT7HS36_9BACT|nr:thiol:disulfide interchange protein DsbA/DsbL [Campylobacter gastrosuis]MDL0089448.1 thiol:disulfide interchange protein DsbA/DsbL [Campylobacter gastrosuis]